MRQLLPTVIDDVDVEACYLADRRAPSATRPWVVVNTASTADGAITFGGRSGGIGGLGDRLAFHALRAVADVILVGAGTARAEHYGPAVVHPQHVGARARGGRADDPRLALVSRSLDLDLDTPLFTDSPARPIVITVESSPSARRDAVEEVADVLVVGETDVHLGRALDCLADLGAAVVLVEGGPTINGQLLADDLVDEWCLTIGASLAGGSALRAAVAPSPGVRTHLFLDRLLAADAELLLRYLVVREP